MKVLSVLFLFFSINAFSVSNSKVLEYRLSRCLGREELKLHKNSDNFYYYLNQIMINKVTGIKGVTIADSIFYQACSSKNSYPSLTILKGLLERFENAFTYIPSTSSVHTRGQVQAFLLELPEILKTLSIHVKKDLPLKCINKHAPELNFIEKYMYYLLEDMTFKSIVKKNKRIFKLFNKIKDPKYFQKKCKL